MDVLNPTKTEVVDIDVSTIKTRLRLRTPDENKVIELADSIKLCGLLNPITIDIDHFLIAGFHRMECL